MAKPEKGTRSRRIDEEWVCADSLIHRLKQIDNRTVVIDKENDDPPDFWLTVGMERFPVEVTSIADETEISYNFQCRDLEHAPSCPRGKGTASNLTVAGGTTKSDNFGYQVR